MGVSMHHTRGQRPAVLLQAFTSYEPAIVGSAQACHKLLSSKRQRRRLTGEPQYAPNEQDYWDLQLPHVVFAHNNKAMP